MARYWDSDRSTVPGWREARRSRQPMTVREKISSAIWSSELPAVQGGTAAGAGGMGGLWGCFPADLSIGYLKMSTARDGPENQCHDTEK